MEFTLREWLMIIGVIVIIGVLLDGFRRVRSSKRNTLKLDIDKNLAYRAGDRVDYYNGELPSGKVRVVNRKTLDDEDLADDQPAEFTMENAGGDIVPDPLFLDDPDALPEAEEPVMQGITAAESPAKAEAAGSKAVDKQPAASRRKEARPVQREVDEVLVVNVVSKLNPVFNGSELTRVVLACGLRYGEMGIFHRNEADDGSGAIQFSMANMVKPGTFDMDNIDNFETPGVTFFLSLPGPEDSMKAYEYMVETAQAVARNLHGELKDEQHSAMTGQTIEHGRQKIRDYERRQISLLG